MTFRTLVLAAVLASLLGAFVLVRPAGGAQSLVRPDQLRFRLVGDEQIASPDGRNVVANWKVVILRDSASGQCYTMFVGGAAMTAIGPNACP